MAFSYTLLKHDAGNIASEVKEIIDSHPDCTRMLLLVEIWKLVDQSQKDYEIVAFDKAVSVTCYPGRRLKLKVGKREVWMDWNKARKAINSNSSRPEEIQLRKLLDDSLDTLRYSELGGPAVKINPVG